MPISPLRRYDRKFPVNSVNAGFPAYLGIVELHTYADTLKIKVTEPSLFVLHLQKS